MTADPRPKRSLEGATSVVISATVMYAVFAVVLHLWGEHLRSSRSAVTLALAALLGSICARAVQGNYPNLGGWTGRAPDLACAGTALRGADDLGHPTSASNAGPG